MKANESMKAGSKGEKAVSTERQYTTAFTSGKDQPFGYKGNYEWWNNSFDAYDNESFIEDDEGIKLRLEAPSQKDGSRTV